LALNKKHDEKRETNKALLATKSDLKSHNHRFRGVEEQTFCVPTHPPLIPNLPLKGKQVAGAAKFKYMNSCKLLVLM